MSTPIRGSASMAKGIRIPIDSPLLEKLLEGIQQHADWVRPCPNAVPFEEFACRYHDRDYKLYDLAADVAAEAETDSGANPLLQELRQAIQGHSQWLSNAHIARGVEGYASQQYDRDIKLYDAARNIRWKALQAAEDPGICLESQRLKAIVTGKSAVLLMPVEFDAAGEFLPSYYAIGGGKGRSYALYRAADKENGVSAGVISHRRLQVVSVEMLRVGDICDEDARLTGFPSIPDLLDYGTALHGRFPFDAEVWRYEVKVLTP